MEEYLNFDGVIDPEVRAHVYSLVTALGGTSASEDGRYILGDDALACLKDIKRWLKLHDEKLNRLDVTRCLAEAHLVKGDLLEILGQWPEEAMNEKWMGRISLACVELLVPLTWPVERDLMTEMTRNQHRHFPYIQVAQVTYKREILEHHSGDILKKAVRLALPSIATSERERTPRDEGIIKLILYLVRNMAIISAPNNLPVEWNEQEVSRSATIKAFDQQDVFAMILSIASNIASDFKTQDVVILEVLFHLIKGIDPKKLFMSKRQRNAATSDELKDLMRKETDMLKTFTKTAPTRHNRFGTMVWVEREESKRSTVTGQDVLRKGQNVLDKMDKTKKWNKPVRMRQQDKTHMTFDLPEALSEQATNSFRKFIEDFIDAGFNPLFEHLRKAIEREADRVLIAHSQQFWYLVSWFLRAESERRRFNKEIREKEGKSATPIETDSFGVVASVLNQETFILLNRSMQNHLDNKEWAELDAAMRCFTQVLLTVQEMAESPLDEDQEIAENIQNNIFYEETTHDRVLAILRGYKNQGFSYLDATTEMAHVFLRLLERYSKENGDLQIRSRRKARRKKKQQEKKDEQDKTDQQGEENPSHDSEAEDEAHATQVTRERKFSFERFVNRFINQSSVDTFFRYLGYYKDLSNEQLKRAHRFFYRVAFKQELSVLLFRIDIIQLLNRMVKSPDSLHRSHPMYGEWSELTKQLFRRLVKKLKERPEIAVELLFSKIPATVHYLEHGYEKETVQSVPRAPAELEVRGGLPKSDQVGVVVAVLVDEKKTDAIDWVLKQLRSAAEERRAWEDAEVAKSIESQAPADQSESPDQEISVDPAGTSKAEPPQIAVLADNEARRLAMFRDNKLRLLLTLVGAERVGFKDDSNAPWYLPSGLSSKDLLDVALTIEQHKASPTMSYGEGEDDPVSAADMLKRKPPPRPTRGSTAFEDDEDGIDDFLVGDEEFSFPAGGPTARRSDVLEELKTRRRRRRRDSDAEELDPETLERRRQARLLKELEKRRKIKSTEFVHESDDESDDERDKAFFTREKETARLRSLAHDKAQAQQEQMEKVRGQVDGKGKRKRGNLAASEGARKRLRSSDDEADAGGSESEDAANSAVLGMDSESDEDTLFVSRRKVRKSSSARQPMSDAGDATDLEDEAEQQEEDEDTPMSSQSEPRVEKLALSETDGNRGQAAVETAAKIGVRDEADDEEDVPPTQRRRARAAVLDDSDDE